MGGSMLLPWIRVLAFDLLSVCCHADISPGFDDSLLSHSHALNCNAQAIAACREYSDVLNISEIGREGQDEPMSRIIPCFNFLKDEFYIWMAERERKRELFPFTGLKACNNQSMTRTRVGQWKLTLGLWHEWQEPNDLNCHHGLSRSEVRIQSWGWNLGTLVNCRCLNHQARGLPPTTTLTPTPRQWRLLDPLGDCQQSMAHSCDSNDAACTGPSHPL